MICDAVEICFYYTHTGAKGYKTGNSQPWARKMTVKLFIYLRSAANDFALTHVERMNSLHKALRLEFGAESDR
jgi:hypothetical protein